MRSFFSSFCVIPLSFPLARFLTILLSVICIPLVIWYIIICIFDLVSQFSSFYLYVFTFVNEFNYRLLKLSMNINLIIKKYTLFLNYHYFGFKWLLWSIKWRIIWENLSSISEWNNSWLDYSFWTMSYQEPFLLELDKKTKKTRRDTRNG